MIIKTLHIIKILLYLFFISTSYANAQQTTLKNDSITQWIKSSKNSSYSLKARKLYLKMASDALKRKKTDTSSTRALSKIAYQYLKLNDASLFKDLNEETYQLALNIKDTFALADIHWNNANYYKKKEVYDSAYYHYNKAYNYFERINQQNYAAKMLYGMSFIKGRYRDYSGSEILIIRAISKYKALKKNKALYSSYNHLALLQKGIKEYDRALFYHNKALSYLNKIENQKDFHKISLNIIGLVYLEKGENSKALEYFNKILEDDSLRSKNIERFAKAIDNRAYCKFISNDTIGVKQDFYAALKIRDSINSKEGIVISKIHLSEFHAFIQDTFTAIRFAKEANILAKNIKNSRDYLVSLKLLASIDANNAENYLKNHITYSDSLQDFDRKIQNKFTRIAYETDEYIEETERLSRQKIRILIISLVMIFIVSLIYYIITQKSRNKTLLLETEQQKANEKVYILTLKQQAKLEEEKTKERNRISQELHDNILGKLFGVRVDLGFLEIKGDHNTLEKHESFLKELQSIEKEIREVSHKLSSNFSSSEIDFSALLNQLLENKSHLGNFTYQLNIGEHVVWNDLNEIIKVNLYRILQEALQNIVKYSNAKNTVLDLSIKNDTLIVRLNDNGIGFDIQKRKKGIGIKNMRSRVRQLKGTLDIESKINEGTSVQFTIPIN